MENNLIMCLELVVRLGVPFLCVCIASWLFLDVVMRGWK